MRHMRLSVKRFRTLSISNGKEAAKKYSKPLILFPRRAAFNEHRNDHQLATAEQLRRHVGIYVAWTEDELEALLFQGDLTAPEKGAVSPELAKLQTTLRAFLRGEPV